MGRWNIYDSGYDYDKELLTYECNPSWCLTCVLSSENVAMSQHLGGDMEFPFGAVTQMRSGEDTELSSIKKH